MYTRHICVKANERIAEISPENTELAKMLGEFADVCEAGGKKAVTLERKKGSEYFMAGSYCGFACLSDGTLLEILPPVRSSANDAATNLTRQFSARA